MKASSPLFWLVIAFIYFSSWSSIFFVYVSKSFPNIEYPNLACSVTLLWSGGSISSPARNSYLSIFLNDNADIFAASLLASYYRFLSLILSSIVMISFFVLSIRFYLKRKALSDARVASKTKRECDFSVHFLQRFIRCLKSISD